MTITLESYLMGKSKFNTLTPELQGNAKAMVQRIDAYLTDLLGKDYQVKVNDGYRLPNDLPKNGSPTSWHYRCGAIDLDDDTQGSLWDLVSSKLDLLTKHNLYMEDPRWTPGWLHFQIYPPKSGKRIFIPSIKPPLCDRGKVFW